MRSGVLLCGILLLLGACTSSEFQYVRESRSNVVFKLPEQWQLYEADELLDSSGVQGESPESILWVVGFEGEPDSGAFDDLFGSGVPVGMARIRLLTNQEERDRFSLSSLRNEYIPIDLIEAQGSQVEVLSQEEVTLESLHGVRQTFNIHTPNGVNTFNKTALMDPNTTAVFLFIIGCESDCYETNQSVIDEVVSSYTIGGSG